jgi:cell division septation protein DedD
MQRNLQKRGYKVQVKVRSHPKLGQIHVVQLEPVAGVDKANTLVAQIRNEQKVNPIIQKVPGGE